MSPRAIFVRVHAAFHQDLPPVLQVGEISPAKHEVQEERDQRAPMRDGVRLMVDIFRPQAEGRFPAILWQTPYNKSGGAARARKFAVRGYVVVNVDSRGRFDSEGQWDPFSPLHKSDGYDLVEWLAKQRVEISSSYYPYYLRNLNTGEDNLALATKPVVARQTIRHDAGHPSHIVLPVIPSHERR